MKNEILLEITNFCEECASHECCPESDCVLYRIEQIVERRTDNANNKYIQRNQRKVS